MDQISRELWVKQALVLYI